MNWLSEAKESPIQRKTGDDPIQQGLRWRRLKIQPLKFIIILLSIIKHKNRLKKSNSKTGSRAKKSHPWPRIPVRSTEFKKNEKLSS
jgi:hypothetical protein